MIALALGILSLLAVIAFHFPAYLTTPELRKNYDVDVLRLVLLSAMVLAGALALLNILFGRTRWLSSVAFALVALAAVLGGHTVPVADFPDGTPYVGLDWFILDLLGSTLVFIALEKLFPLYREQLVFRKEWQTDLKYFAVNHFLVGLILLTVNVVIHRAFGWMVIHDFQLAIQRIAFVPQLFLCILVAFSHFILLTSHVARQCFTITITNVITCCCRTSCGYRGSYFLTTSYWWCT